MNKLRRLNRLFLQWRNLIKIKSVVFILSLIYHGCSTEIPDKAYDYLAPPLITSYECINDKIKIDFIGYNDEYYFDGYNVYVSDSSLAKTYVTSYKPVQVEDFPSAEPSFPLSPEDYDPEKTRTLYLYQFFRKIEGEYVPFTFEDGVAYNIFLCSHHRQGTVYEEGVSNQVSVVFESGN